MDGFTGAWTYECFVYPTSWASPWQSIFSVSTLQGDYLLLALTSGQKTMTYLSSEGAPNASWNIANNLQGATNANLNQWNHVALVFTGTAYVTYLNGVEQTRASTSTQIPAAILASNVMLMSFNGSQNPAQPVVSGNLDEVRISSSARYTTTPFTPPSAEFSNDDATILLHHFNGTNASTAWSTSGQDTTLFSDTGINLDSRVVSAREVYGALVTAARATVNGPLLSSQSVEMMMPVTASSATVTVDTNLGGIFFITPANGTNITLNITNVPTTGVWRSYNYTVILSTATNKVYVSTLQVNGTGVTLNYSGGVSSVSVSSATYVVQTFNVVFNGTATTPLVAFTSVSSMS